MRSDSLGVDTNKVARYALKRVPQKRNKNFDVVCRWTNKMHIFLQINFIFSLFYYPSIIRGTT